MTTPDFLSLLENVRDQFQWSLKADSGRHSERRARPRFHLLATHAKLPDVELGPVRAVCFARTGKALSADFFAEAVEILGMDSTEVRAIASAAADNTWEGDEGHRVPAGYLVALRRELLSAVGLITHVTF